VVSLPSIAKEEPVEIEYKRIGGLSLRADVHGATGEAGRPVVVWIHGGGLINGTKNWIGGGQVRELANRGYTVFSVDYRLAPETPLAELVQDVEDAVEWVRGEGASRFGYNPDRLAVMGASAGGYLTLLMGCRLDPPAQALVAYYGYGNIVADWYAKPDPFYLQQERVTEEEARGAVGKVEISGATGAMAQERGKFYLYCRQQGVWPKEVAGLNPAEHPEFFQDFCPAMKVTPDYPPTLLLHGDADTDVPYSQSEEMAAALERAGVEHELLRVKGGPHGFDTRKGGLEDEENRLLFERVAAFLEANLK
jgi:acetyl esterase/lipase